MGMTRDDVFEMAREVGLVSRSDAWSGLPSLYIDRLESFAAAIEAKVKADLLAGAGEPTAYRVASSYWTHQESVPEALRAEQEALYTADQVAAAVLRERKECAKVCEEVGSRDRDNHAWDAADSIRARGNTT